eukprot:6416298-Amphidinium_carterae.1
MVAGLSLGLHAYRAPTLVRHVCHSMLLYLQCRKVVWLPKLLRDVSLCTQVFLSSGRHVRQP